MKPPKVQMVGFLPEGSTKNTVPEQMVGETLSLRTCDAIAGSESFGSHPNASGGDRTRFHLSTNGSGWFRKSVMKRPEAAVFCRTNPVLPVSDLIEGTLL